MNYSIKHQRDLSPEEVRLLEFLLTDSGHHSYLNQLQQLKVVARCGCGKCPTVLLGESLEAAPQPNGADVTQYMGQNADGVQVGVTLMAVNGILSELEASSLSGEAVSSWPSIKSLQAMGC